jgi:hypothetical protein
MTIVLTYVAPQGSPDAVQISSNVFTDYIPTPIQVAPAVTRQGGQPYLPGGNGAFWMFPGESIAISQKDAVRFRELSYPFTLNNVTGLALLLSFPSSTGYIQYFTLTGDVIVEQDGDVPSNYELKQSLIHTATLLARYFFPKPTSGNPFSKRVL